MVRTRAGESGYSSEIMPLILATALPSEQLPPMLRKQLLHFRPAAGRHFQVQGCTLGPAGAALPGFPRGVCPCRGLSGAGRYLDSIEWDLESTNVLVSDGGSAGLLAAALSLRVDIR